MNEKNAITDEDDDVDSLELTPASRKGSRRAMSGKGLNAKSPRSTAPGEKTFTATLDHGVSGTTR
jgi:hypothetical protein